MELSRAHRRLARAAGGTVQAGLRVFFDGFAGDRRDSPSGEFETSILPMIRYLSVLGGVTRNFLFRSPARAWRCVIRAEQVSSRRKKRV